MFRKTSNTFTDEKQKKNANALRISQIHQNVYSQRRVGVDLSRHIPKLPNIHIF